MSNDQTIGWEAMPLEEKNAVLFQRQKEMLALFLRKGVISQAQHDKSLGDLIAKMRFNEFN